VDALKKVSLICEKKNYRRATPAQEQQLAERQETGEGEKLHRPNGEQQQQQQQQLLLRNLQQHTRDENKRQGLFYLHDLQYIWLIR
jgi:hypothetical protein